jgi:ubiquinone/menaquinone biosynthesis C-methylase UbiE
MKQAAKKEEIESFYKEDKVVDNYIQSRFETPIGKQMHIEQFSFINNIIKKNKIKKILEIACGPARITSDVENFKEGFAMDSSEGMLKIAKQRLKTKNWKLSKGDAFNLKFKPKSFDLVYTFRFIRHFHNDKRKAMYDEIKKLLKDKGLLIFDAVNYEKSYSVRKRVGFHKYTIYDILYKKKDLIKEIESNGFEIVHLKPIINHLYLSTAISKMAVLLKINKVGEEIIRLIEKIPSSKPLEWIVLCRKK